MADKKGYGVGALAMDMATAMNAFYGGVEQKTKQAGAYMGQMGTDFMKIWNPSPPSQAQPFPQHPDISQGDIERYRSGYLEGKIPTSQWPEMIRTLKIMDAQQGAK
jgi:hypothetical protein